MLSKAALVATLLCCIAQVALIPSVLGSELQSSNLIINIRVKIVTKNTSQILEEKCVEIEALPPLKVNMTAPSKLGLFAKWDPVLNTCQNISGYQVTLTEVAGGVPMTNTTTKASFIYGGLKASTAYRVQVWALNGTGQPIVNTMATAEQTTQAGVLGCIFPAIDVLYFTSEGLLGCGKVIKPAPGTLAAARQLCRASFKSTEEGIVFYDADTNYPFDDILATLRKLDYTEDILVDATYSNGAWQWNAGFGGIRVSGPVALSRLVGVPAGGVGPDDYKMLYLDPAKNLGFSAAKDGHAFGGVFCEYVLPQGT